MILAYVAPTPNPSPAGLCLRDPKMREGLKELISGQHAPLPSLWGLGLGDGV